MSTALAGKVLGAVKVLLDIANDGEMSQLAKEAASIGQEFEMAVNDAVRRFAQTPRDKARNNGHLAIVEVAPDKSEAVEDGLGEADPTPEDS